MIDFSEKPIVKSEEEAEFDDLREKYYEKFGEYYGFVIGSGFPNTLRDAIAEMKKCIETGKKQKMSDLKGGEGY